MNYCVEQLLCSVIKFVLKILDMSNRDQLNTELHALHGITVKTDRWRNHWSTGDLLEAF